MSTNLTVNNNLIIIDNLELNNDPSTGLHAVRKSWLDSEIDNIKGSDVKDNYNDLTKIGISIDNIIGENLIEDLSNLSKIGERITNIDNNYLNKNGDIMNGNLNNANN